MSLNSRDVTLYYGNMKRVLGVVWGLIGLVPAWACMPESAVAARASAAGEFQPGLRRESISHTDRADGSGGAQGGP